MTIGQIVVFIFTGMLIVSFFAWIIYLIFWFFKKIGFFRWLLFRKLRRRFGINHQFNEDVFAFVSDIIEKDWDYKTIKQVAKRMPERDEVLYAYFMIKKAKRRYR